MKMKGVAHPDDAKSVALPPEERIGSYRVEGLLGQGGLSEVFLAWDERLGRQVAIKRIRRDTELSAEQRERFRREARLASHLSHPAILQIYDFVTSETDDAIVMEYVEGRTLAERLAADRLETDEVLRLALDIAQGLAAAHRVGVIHRDLKAANIIVTPAGHAKILDFGLARPVGCAPKDQDFTRRGVVLGTTYAMSPEQVRGEALDLRSDLFSFGALVHEMLTGRPPFLGKDAIDSLRRVVSEDPVDPRLARPDLPAEATALLLRLLAKNRDERPSSADEVVKTLARLSSGSGSAPLSLAGTASSLQPFLTSADVNARFRGLFSFRWALLLMLAVILSVVLVINGSSKLQEILGWSILLGTLVLLVYLSTLPSLRNTQLQGREKRRQDDVGIASRRDAIDELYIELRQLVSLPGADPQEIQSRLAQLRALQREEAERIRRSLNEGLHLKPGTGYQALEEARRLLAEHARPSPQNLPPSR